ncbi:mucin-associated surface protein (MASP) [Trypanosoma cruzi]|nr:mucin-associated surface protein (MASP) [Trypanosoma cruzi]
MCACLREGDNSVLDYSIRHCGLIWCFTAILLDSAFDLRLLGLLWGRWEAEGMRTEFIVWLRSVEFRPAVALFWGLTAVSFAYFPPQQVDNTDPRNICLTACGLLPCVVHGPCDCVGRCVGVTNTSVWRVAVCRNDVRMACGGCCL